MVNIAFLSTRADRQGVDLSFTVYLFVCVFVCSDGSLRQDKASGVKFCTVVLRRSGQEISHFGELCSPEAPPEAKRLKLVSTDVLVITVCTCYRY